MSERVLSSAMRPEEAPVEQSLRPRNLAEYIGQERVVDNLQVLLQAAKGRAEPLDHILLYGPPGLGKTTLANVIAAEMGVSIKITSGPVIERPGDLAAILTNLRQGDILFIDEVHRLSRVVEEVLYPAMEDFALDIVIGKGPAARIIRLNLPRLHPHRRHHPHRTDDLAPARPLRRCIPAGLSTVRRPCEPSSSARRPSCRSLSSRAASQEIASRARGTPRVANRLLKRVRDYAQVRGRGIIDTDIAHQALDLLEVDHLGPR